MLIAFYSNVRGNAGTTSNLCCLATYLAIRTKQKILLWENHTNWNMIEDNVTPRTKLSFLSKSFASYHISGSKELFCRLQQKENLDLSWQVKELAKELYPGTLYYLPNRQMESSLFEKEIASILPKLVKLCKESDDLVFMDLQDITKESTRFILEQADLVILNLMQHVNSSKGILTCTDISISKIRYLIGNYQPNSKFNVKNISRRYKIPIMDIATIPYNTLCREAMAEGRLLDFISANVECTKGDSNYSFLHAVKQAAEMLNEAIEEARQDRNEQVSVLPIKTEAVLPMQSISKGRCEDCYI
ncbi:MAG: hypothetical protein KIC94_16565 [Clostridiales bacterium]|nr:hypothetical protein [uncultured Anaerosporobacter sp.]MBS5934476.1 hypothetical protein [Clostridiales bacterium]